MNSTPGIANILQPGQGGVGVLCEGVQRGGYRVRLARSETDVRAAQALRFLVFNVELNEGSEAAFDTCRDTDAFDPVCDHLLVEEVASEEVVGTYRLQTGRRATQQLGFYSDREFDFAPFSTRHSEMLELGRACVRGDHRSLGVITLLWRGITAYARRWGCRYLIGCSSVPTTDPERGARLYSDLMRTHLAPPHWRTGPRATWACPLDRLARETVKPPRLLGAYLALGAKICGPPALDRDFKTIDLLTIMDLESLSPVAADRFLR